MNLKKELIDGNFKYHWKLIKEQKMEDEKKLMGG